MKASLPIAMVIASVVSADYIRKTYVEPVVQAGSGDWRSLEEKGAEGGTEVFGARIHIAGLSAAPTKEELAFLDQVLPEAFNAAHETIGLEMENSTSKTSLVRDSDEGGHDFMIISEIAVQWNGGNDTGDRACYADPVCNGFLVDKKAEAHLNFEARLCQNLRASGINSFAEATDCSFLIVENPGSSSTRLTEEIVYEARDYRPTGVEISMLGLVENPPPDAIHFMESALVETHNEAYFDKFRYALGALEIVSMTPFSYGDVVDTFLLFGHAIPHSKRHYDPSE
eukprot:scaffold10056_cov164-Amphora_coffeaeformis.AAC.1